MIDSKKLTADEYAKYVTAAKQLKYTPDQFQLALTELTLNGKDDRSSMMKDLRSALDAQVCLMEEDKK